MEIYQVIILEITCKEIKKKKSHIFCSYASFSSVTNFETPVLAWFDEHVDYDFNSSTCAYSKMCGHYLQVVSANTTKVGCSYKTCNNLIVKNSVVCYYSPSMNFLQPPYVAYETANNSNSIIISITLLILMLIKVLF